VRLRVLMERSVICLLFTPLCPTDDGPAYVGGAMPTRPYRQGTGIFLCSQ